MPAERRVAVYWDLENVRSEVFDLSPVIDLASTQGRIVVNRAYGDWSSDLRGYADQVRRHGLDLIQLFPTAGAKNGVDIRLTIDVVEDLRARPDVTDVLLVTGDSDFVSLVQHCRRHGRRVHGVGARGRASAALQAVCDSFHHADDLPSSAGPPPLVLVAATPSCPQPSAPREVRKRVVGAMRQLAPGFADGWVPRADLQAALPAAELQARCQARSFGHLVALFKDVVVTANHGGVVVHRLRATA